MTTPLDATGNATVSSSNDTPTPVDYRTSGYRNHVVWGILGLAGTASLWWAGTVIGAVSLFVVIGLAFVIWNRIGSRGSWVAVLVIGSIMSVLLGWQAATAARCPGHGDELVMSLTKPGVDCAQLRASAASMSVLFGLFAIFAAAAPFMARKARAAAEAQGDVDVDLAN